MHLVGFTIEIYYNAWSYKCKKMNLMVLIHYIPTDNVMTGHSFCYM